MRLAKPTFLVGAALLASAQTQPSLMARWGLQSPNDFETALEIPGSTTLVRKTSGVPSVRAFRFTSAYNGRLVQAQARKVVLLQQYLASRPAGGGGAIDRAAFIAFARARDPFYVALSRNLAPTLYFDFTGLSGKQYVLDQIQIRTIAFEEYQGGGTFDHNAWYDIELSPKVGTRTYPVNRRLVFTGEGRAELKFWSGNYYPMAGEAPMGSYLLDVKFDFISDGKTVAYRTGPFRIDV